MLMFIVYFKVYFVCSLYCCLTLFFVLFVFQSLPLHVNSLIVTVIYNIYTCIYVFYMTINFT